MILLYIAIAIVGILLIREIFTWYWKLNSIVYELEKQNKTLTNIAEELKSLKNIDA